MDDRGPADLDPAMVAVGGLGAVVGRDGWVVKPQAASASMPGWLLFTAGT